MTNIRQWKSLTQQLKKVLEGLPSSAERDELVGCFRQLISVLEELCKTLGTLPTAEEASRAKESLAKLESVINNNPLLRGQATRGGVKVGLQKKTRELQPDLSYPKEHVDQILESFSRMPEGTLRAELENPKSYPNSLLRKMLIQLGRRVPSKGVRRELAEQLAVTIINRRTYEGLRGEQNRE